MAELRSITSTNICFDCEKAVGGCTWARNFIVPEGATYQPVYDKNKPGVVLTMNITACPLFERSPNRRSVGIISEEENENMTHRTAKTIVGHGDTTP